MKPNILRLSRFGALSSAGMLGAAVVQAQEKRVFQPGVPGAMSPSACAGGLMPQSAPVAPPAQV